MVVLRKRGLLEKVAFEILRRVENELKSANSRIKEIFSRERDTISNYLNNELNKSTKN